jgi:nucleoside 2-deoxyribosyltransferase
VLIYLAGPIGQRSLNDANSWRKEATNYLAYHNIGVLNPLRGKTEENRPYYTPGEIVTRDKQDIINSNAILVYWPEREISNGTAMEIEFAFENDKMILFVGDWAQKDIWIKYHATKIFHNLESALNYISAML